MSKNKFIKSLSIKGTKYKIKIVPLDDDHGKICYKTKIIKLDSNDDEEQRARTLLHEIGHGIFNELSFNQPINEQLEEVIVDNFANVFYDLFFKK